MICPHCRKSIPDKTVARHLASKGGKKGDPEAKRRAGKLGGLAKAKRDAEIREESTGAKIAAEMRAEANSLTPAQRRKLHREGLLIIQGKKTQEQRGEK